MDIDDAASLEAALKGVSLVVHTAGPFQRKDTCGVLEAAIATKTPYMDVCDDTEHSQRLRAYSDQAKAAGVPAITTAGMHQPHDTHRQAYLGHMRLYIYHESERLAVWAGSGRNLIWVHFRQAAPGRQEQYWTVPARDALMIHHSSDASSSLKAVPHYAH